MLDPVHQCMNRPTYSHARMSLQVNHLQPQRHNTSQRRSLFLFRKPLDARKNLNIKFINPPPGRFHLPFVKRSSLDSVLSAISRDLKPHETKRLTLMH